MGADKGGNKTGGFFQLFDLKRKSRKKLFSSRTSPESSKEEKKSNSNVPSTRLHLEDEDETVGVSSVRESSDFSCASSVTDEAFSSKPPGVVARLMGLDSMPTAGSSDPSSTPYFDTRFLHEKLSHKRSPDFCINDQFNNIPHRIESYMRKPMDLRTQRMPSSPIERFQTETIPPRSAKSLPLNSHKLLSPIKNPGFISGKNAAHIMEAAAKMLDPGPQCQSTTRKVSSFGSPSIPLKARDSKDSMLATQSQRTSRILESARNPAESRNVRYLRGQSSSRFSDGVEDSFTYRQSPDCTDISEAKNKGKSVSLAIQAKVNVQRREGLSSSGKKMPVNNDHEERKVDQTFRSQPNHQTNKQQRKPATTNASGVLRQNNQKQNCLTNRNKLSANKSITNQHARKVTSGSDAKSVKNKAANKFTGNSRVLMKTANIETDEVCSTSKDFPQKKRLIERSFLQEKGESTRDATRDRHQKQVQPNLAIDEHLYLRWAENSRSNGTDVVSFTFTSPLRKPTPVPESSIQMVDKWDKRNTIFGNDPNQNDSDVKDKNPLSHDFNVVTGDALSVLLEQKLRELTSGVGSSNCSFLEADSSTASSSITQHSPYDFDARSTSTAESRNAMHELCRDNLAGSFHPGVSSTNGRVFGLSKLQRIEEVECSSISDARKDETDQNLSPVSTLESSFSNGSLASTDSSDSIKGSKVCSSSIQAKNITNTNSTIEMELSDSASSTLTETSVTSKPTKSQRRANEELDYVRELANLWSPLNSNSLDTHIFNNMEYQGNDDYNGKMTRKLLFDCVNECLDSKCSTYFQGGYDSWSKGMSRNGGDRGREIYEEISGWKGMWEWSTDELVDKDMSTRRGRWVDFEVEAFEAGKEVENEIVEFLIDEVVAELFI